LVAFLIAIHVVKYNAILLEQHSPKLWVAQMQKFGSSSFRVGNPRSISVAAGWVATAVPVAATIHRGTDPMVTAFYVLDKTMFRADA
jgi:hypothetical protein